MSFAHAATAPGTVTASALADGDRRHAEAAIAIEGRAGGRPARAVQRNHLALAAAHQERKAVAADAALRRLDHAEQRDRGNRSVDRVAAAAQDVERSERRERVRGRGHGLGCERFGAARQLEIAQREVTERQASVPQIGDQHRGRRVGDAQRRLCILDRQLRR